MRGGDMIRKAITIVLATLAVASLMLGLYSYARPVHLDLSGGNDRWFWVHFSHGAVTVSYVDGRLPSFAERAYGRIIDMLQQELAILEEMRASGSPPYDVGHPRQDERAKTLRESATRCRQFVGEVRRRIALSMISKLRGEVFRADASRTPTAEALVHFPLWAPVLLFVIYPTIAFVRSPVRRRHHRRKRGLCIRCGYNLTGNVTGVCPECGNPI